MQSQDCWVNTVNGCMKEALKVSSWAPLQMWTSASRSRAWTEPSASIRSPTSPACVPPASREPSARQVTAFLPRRYTKGKKKDETLVDIHSRVLTLPSCLASRPVLQHFPASPKTILAYLHLSAGGDGNSADASLKLNLIQSQRATHAHGYLCNVIAADKVCI